MARFGWIAGLVGLAAAIGVGSTVFRVPIADALFNRAVSQAAGRNTAAELPDGLHVYVCGAGSPLPDPQRAGPCLGIVAGEQVFIIDTGSGGVRNLARMGFPLDDLDSVLLTHLHSDHIDGLGETLMQAWVNGGRDVPLPVYGPEGVAEVVAGFNAAYRIDATYRFAHHGLEIANPDGRGGSPRTIRVPEGAGTLDAGGGVTITAYKVDHAPVEPAFGYRIDYKGRSVSISGDTVYSANLVAASRGADILFHEALNPDMVIATRDAMAARGRDDLAKILGDIIDYHATPADAARAADAAGVSQLVLYHTVPPLPSRQLYPLFLKDTAEIFAGKLEIAEDGVIYSLPAASRAIEKEKVF